VSSNDKKTTSWQHIISILYTMLHYKFRQLEDYNRWKSLNAHSVSNNIPITTRLDSSRCAGTPTANCALNLSSKRNKTGTRLDAHMTKWKWCSNLPHLCSFPEIWFLLRLWTRENPKVIT